MTEHITVVGSVGTDPERRQTSDGSPVLGFRLAARRSHRDRETGQWVDDGTSWYRVSAYRALAENGLASIRKGDRVIVSGRLKLREWEAGDRRGTEAEIDADALGPDLLWGRTRFERTAKAGAAAPTSDADAAPTEDGWATPGDADARALVSAGGATGADTPF